jgi:hypothetical protein
VLATDLGDGGDVGVLGDQHPGQLPQGGVDDLDLRRAQADRDLGGVAAHGGRHRRCGKAAHIV